MPYSPAWDAAMTMVEDLERVLWQMDHPTRPTEPDRVRSELMLERVLA